MCNCESDFNCVPKYKPKYSLIDKLFMGLIFVILALCAITIVTMLLNPHYFN